MRYDTVILGGGLAGLVAGISLQQEGQHTAIVSMGQNALHFFSGSFESLQEPPQRLTDLFLQAGIRLHYRSGVRLMPLGTFREASLSLEDIDIFPTPCFARRVLIVSFPLYHDFFSSFLAEGLQKAGMQCRVRLLNLPEMEGLQQSASQMRPVQMARTMDRIWEKVVQEVRLLLRDEDAVVLPQVFGLQDTTVPERIRRDIPARVVFAGTMPPSIPGIRTQMLLRKRYQLLGGTYLMGDQAIRAHIHQDVVHSVVTRNLDSHYLEASHFILATGGLFSKGLVSNPFQIYEPVFGLDVEYAPDRNTWYNPSFLQKQPYMGYGVRTDAALHALREGRPMKNLFAIGSILGATRPELGTAGGAAVRSAFAAVDEILARPYIPSPEPPSGHETLNEAD